MRRFILVLMLVLLPLQMSWSVAGAYCRHETGDSAQHFGHHAHIHHDAGGDVRELGALPADDADCGHCQLSHNAVVTPHLATLPPLRASAQGIAASPPAIAFIPPDRPERPNWRLNR